MYKSIALAFTFASSAVLAQTVDPAIAIIQSLDEGLVAIMQAGTPAGVPGRARIIAPIIDRAFDIPLMTRLSVGPAWTKIPERQQSALIAAFRSMTVASYARNFDGYSGERFVVTPQVTARAGDRLVKTVLTSPGENPVAISYRLRQNSGQWKIIDVYYKNSISQLATRRSDFARVLASGGAPALITHLNRLATAGR